MLADGPAKLRGFNVVGMNGVCIERCTIPEKGDEAGVVGAWEAKRIKAGGQTFNLRNDCSKTAEQLDMGLTHFRLNLCSIFPDNNVR